jgi:hypothetical protein
VRNLYYYFGELKRGDEDALINFLPSTLTPIFSYIKDSKKITLLVFADWREADKVVWKKFRDPEFHKYITASFFKVGMIGEEETEEWKMIERGGTWNYHTLDYSDKIIRVAKGIPKEEENLLKRLVTGKARVYPFEFLKPEQILIL